MSLLDQFLEKYSQRQTAQPGVPNSPVSLYSQPTSTGAERVALAGARQSMVSSGLSGTTKPMAVSATMKAGFEDTRKAKLADAMTNEAKLGLQTAGLEQQNAQFTQQLAMQRKQMAQREREMAPSAQWARGASPLTISTQQPHGGSSLPSRSRLGARY